MFYRRQMSIAVLAALLTGLFFGLFPQVAEAANTSYGQISNAYISNAYASQIQLLNPDAYFVLDDSRTSKGSVTILATSESAETYKVIVIKGDKRYVYDYRGMEQTYPLQMGDGEYRIGFYQNLGNNEYIALHQWRIQVQIKDPEDIFLNKHALLFWNESSQAAELAQRLVKGLDTDQEKATAIYRYLIENFSYDDQVAATLKAGYVPDVDQVLTDKKGICYDFSSLYAVMLRSVNIPAKLVMGTTTNVKGYHAWNEVLLDGKWVVIDTSYDIQAKAAKARYAMVKTNTYKSEKEF